MMPSVLNDWVQELPLMQQSVLLTAIRNEDGKEKDHAQKDLIRWYRRCVLKSAFDQAELRDPQYPGGGSFTGPVENIKMALKNFIAARDGMSLHYYCHMMHAFQILGYKHPVDTIRNFWDDAYQKLVHALHLWPETKEQMDARLGDNKAGWQARDVDQPPAATKSEVKL